MMRDDTGFHAKYLGIYNAMLTQTTATYDNQFNDADAINVLYSKGQKTTVARHLMDWIAAETEPSEAPDAIRSAPMSSAPSLTVSAACDAAAVVPESCRSARGRWLRGS